MATTSTSTSIGAPPRGCRETVGGEVSGATVGVALGTAHDVHELEVVGGGVGWFGDELGHRRVGIGHRPVDQDHTAGAAVFREVFGRGEDFVLWFSGIAGRKLGRSRRPVRASSVSGSGASRLPITLSAMKAASMM